MEYYAGIDVSLKEGSVCVVNTASHLRRRFYERAIAEASPIATEPLQRIALHYAVEKDLRGHGPTNPSIVIAVHARRRFAPPAANRPVSSLQPTPALRPTFPLPATSAAVRCPPSAVKMEDLPEDGSDMITKRVEQVLKQRYGHAELDKRRVMGEMWQRFDTWSKASDLPEEAAKRAEKLFKTINSAFGASQVAEGA